VPGFFKEKPRHYGHHTGHRTYAILSTMKLTPRLHRAIDTAANLHREHTRKGREKTPYITHLFAVAAIVDHYGGSEDMIIAGLMHDTVEDLADFTFDRLEELSGASVRELVEPLTEPKKGGIFISPVDAWRFAKEGYITQMQSSSSDVHIISAADKIHNMNSMLLAFERDPGLVSQSLLTALDRHLWFVRELATIFEPSIPPAMYGEYRDSIESLAKLAETQK
jgi:(p)ppGpp synthase/HD superfamily hydrolase